MTPIYEQIQFFLNTIAIGLIMGIVFDFYRTLKSMLFLKKWAIGIFDLLLCLFFTGMVFTLLLFSNWGEVRVYVFIGLALGLLLYFRYISPFIMDFWQQWFTFFIESIRFIIRLIMLPLKLIIKIVNYPLALLSLLIFGFMERLRPLFRKLKRWVKGSLKKFFPGKKTPPPE